MLLTRTTYLQIIRLHASSRTIQSPANSSTFDISASGFAVAKCRCYTIASECCQSLIHCLIVAIDWTKVETSEEGHRSSPHTESHISSAEKSFLKVNCSFFSCCSLDIRQSGQYTKHAKYNYTILSFSRFVKKIYLTKKLTLNSMTLSRVFRCKSG